MKRLLITLSIVTISVIAFYIYNTSAYKQVRSVFNQIDNGELKYTQTLSGKTLVYNFDLVTSDFVKSVFIKSSNITNYDSLSNVWFEFQYRWFQIPSKVNNYKIVSEHKYQDTLRTLFEEKITVNPNAEFWNIKCKVSDELNDNFYTIIFIKYGRKYKLAAMMKN